LSGEELDSSNGAHEFGSNSARSFVTLARSGQPRGGRAPSQHMASCGARRCWDLSRPGGDRGGHSDASVCAGPYSRRHAL